MQQYDSEYHKGFEIKIFQDDMWENPIKEWGTLCNFKSYHRNYGESLSNVDGFEYQEDLLELINSGDVIFLPLYMYDHSGISISANLVYPYDDKWDAGQLGFVWLDKKEMLKEYNWKIFSKKRIQKIIDRLYSNVDIMNDYVTGNIYGFQVETKNGEDVGSCWGFYGYEHEKSGLLEAAREDIDWYVENKRKEHAEYLKKCISNHVPFQYRKLAMV